MTPRTFRGFNGKAVVYPDRVEIKRALSARIGGAKSSVIPFPQLVKVISKPPTRWLNGWVYLATDPDPAHLYYWADPPKTKVGGNPQAIVYTWFQRDAQAEFIAAVSEVLPEPSRRPAADPLLITLADALANLTVSIDMSDDDDVDPDICVPWLEDVASTLNQLSAGDRHRLAQIIREVAGRESDAQRQAALLETPDHLGLEDSDDE
ncbi:hypothetical protein ACIQ6K_28930 [Streptomyces sp. NPDC096354]|uniref:hypothetical protein n=1 Tax=Streptomyces sp. NPDC096354 TaxID=3366088 RepID=UPI00380AD23A